MPGTGRDFGCVNWEAARWRLAALLTPRPYTLNLDGFGATIRRRPFLRVAPGCKNGLVKRITLHAVARRFRVLQSGW